MNVDLILCPTDFSEASRRAFACASSLADWYAARVTLLHVAQPVAALVGASRNGGGFGEDPGIDLAELRRQIRRGVRQQWYEHHSRNDRDFRNRAPHATSFPLAIRV